MHAFSIFAWAIFVAGYITARWDLVTRLYELAIFAWDHGVVASSSLLPAPERTPPGPPFLTSLMLLDPGSQGLLNPYIILPSFSASRLFHNRSRSGSRKSHRSCKPQASTRRVTAKVKLTNAHTVARPRSKIRPICSGAIATSWFVLRPSSLHERHPDSPRSRLREQPSLRCRDMMG